MGGINHPLFPRVALHDQAKWMTYLSGLDVFKLTYGTGLSVIRSPHQLMRKVAADRARELVYQRDLTRLLEILELGSASEVPLLTRDPGVEHPPRFPTLTEWTEKLASPLITWEFFFRPPVVPESAPSVRRAARKFRTKVSHSLPISGRMANVVRELGHKKDIFVALDPNTGFTSPVLTRYGLEGGRTAQKTVKSHWIPGREMWA